MSVNSLTSFVMDGRTRIPNRTTGTVIDITERKASEMAVREQETRLRAIVDHAVDGIITIDEQGTIESFNSAAERLFGYPAAAVLGQNVKLLMPDPYHREHDGYLAHYRDTGQAKIIGIGREVIGLRQDGSTFPLDLAVSELQLGDRRLFTGIVRDITERKEAEFQLQQAAEIMESRAMEIAQAHERALAATQAKSDFLASMSHEIRTPMNAIIGMADLMHETLLSTEQREYVGRLSRAATSLLDLINDILDLSKIEAGHLELESVAFDLHELVDKTAELMAVRAHAKRLELIAFVHPTIPAFVTGDPTRLRQIFINLVGNAIKFTEEGEVVIRVEPDKTDPTMLHCAVSDTGIGIPEAKLATVFDSFTQVDSSTTRKYGGTGLGLSISKRLVELMHGHIQVDSLPGLGSTFTFSARLPAAPPPAAAPPPPPLPDLQGRRILIVDDTATNRLVIQTHLAPLGAVLLEAADGLEALTHLDEAQRLGTPIDLVILDYHMPNMDGMDLAQAIRKQPVYATLPLLMHASDLRKESVDRARALGITSYAYKPISRKRLLESLTVALSPTAAEPLAERIPAPADSPLPPLLPYRILLVEDLEDNRDLVTLFLKDTPCRLAMADNGLVAVQRCQSETYDLVLMDMQMPVMDGLQATATIRRWEHEHRHAPMPIVALTANAFKDELDKSLAAGCIAHLTKPIKKKTLLAAIAQYATPPSDLAA
ncbi:MAG: response regulator [Nitrospira sp.]|nr:response regulator [Nitrospira sp.]